MTRDPRPPGWLWPLFPAPPTQADSQKVQAADAGSQGLPGQAADQDSRVNAGEPELRLRPTGECPRRRLLHRGAFLGAPFQPPHLTREENLGLAPT